MRILRRQALPAIAAMALSLLSLGVAPAAAGGTSLPKTVSVSTATDSWKGTGITPKAGRAIKVTATGSGTYCSGCVAPTPAEDTTQTSVCGGGYDGLGGVACIALVGRWAGGGAFVIGKSATLTAPGGAELQLGIHDWKFDDNGGTYTATLKAAPDRFDLSGRVRSLTCDPDACTAGPWTGSGSHMVAERQGSDQPRTTTIGGGDGRYRFTDLPKGEWTVVPHRTSPWETTAFAPVSRRVTLDQDRTGADFLHCQPPDDKAATDPDLPPACRKVTVAGRVVDADGDGYEGITVVATTGAGELEKQTDRQGRFSFQLRPGGWTLLTGGHVRRPIRVTGPVSGVVLRGPEPSVAATVQVTRSAPSVVVRLKGLPAAGGRFQFIIRRDTPNQGFDCIDRATQERTRNLDVDQMNLDIVFEPPGVDHYCKGAWKASVRWATRGRLLGQDPFRITVAD